MKYTVLLLGSGGREHALAWAISFSHQLKKLYIAPGNPGTAACGENVDLDVSDHEAVRKFIKSRSVDITVVGPEQPLVDGIADYLEGHGHRVFGPRKGAAMLEGSKEFAKEFMNRHKIPTADYKVFDQSEFDAAAKYIKEKNTYPIVLKADGLAGGKGVFIPENEADAMEFLDELKNASSLKEASERLVIEEFMEGEEASVFAVCDGDSYSLLGDAQDHKRAEEGDTGLNTGGMGAYSPAPVMTKEMLDRVEKEIIAPTVKGMDEEGNPYLGFLYCGLMITSDGPKVVEYNCRFGDPECQVIIPRLDSDLLEIISASLGGRLEDVPIDFDPQYRCCVVLTSGGYPGSYEKGKVITGVEQVDEALIYHAGTAIKNGKLVTNGGRVLNVIGSGQDLKTAMDVAYRDIQKIHFDKAYYRRDIGEKGLKHLK